MATSSSSRNIGGGASRIPASVLTALSAGTKGMVKAPPRARAPMAKPAEKIGWEDELWRLERLYGQSKHFENGDCEDGSRRLKLVHHCTDPDWEAVNWAPHGLHFEIKVPEAYHTQTTQSSGCPEVAPRLSLLEPTDMPPNFPDIVAKLFDEGVASVVGGSPAIYRALQHVDRNLTKLFLKLRARERGEDDPTVEPAASQQVGGSSSSTTAAGPAATSGAGVQWTQEEQDRLTAAMQQLRSVSDPKERWKRVAERVGGGKTAKDCAERFRISRSSTVAREPPQGSLPVAPFAPDPRVPIPSAPPIASATAQGSVATAMTAAEVKRVGVEVRLLGLHTEGISTLLPTVLRIQVVCDRCKKPHDLESEGKGTHVRAVETPCPVCKHQIGITVAPSICHGGCTSLAHVAGESCHPVQLLRSDIEAVCSECTAGVAVRNFGPGFRKRGSCATCGAKSNLTVEGADMLGTAVAHWRQVAQEGSVLLNSRKQLQDARQREKDLGVKLNTPLPYRGACKHFQKSYKWLRFPCCGRAFACPECHDEQMDHPNEYANRMLCGLCSFEQMATKEKCGNCGAATSRTKTAYWEGGEGCRNLAKMAKNDDHKYRGLGKTVSNRAIAKAAAK